MAHDTPTNEPTIDPDPSGSNPTDRHAQYGQRMRQRLGPDWRWRLAERYFEQGHAPDPQFVDDLTRQLVDYLQGSLTEVEPLGALLADVRHARQNLLTRQPLEILILRMRSRDVA